MAFIDRTGEKTVSKCGLEMEIIAYRNNHDLDVRFSDGEIIKNRTYQSFRQGRISHPSISYLRMNYIGEEAENFQGYKMKIIEYVSTIDINVKFEDGTVVEHKYYRAFKAGQIAYPYDKKYIGQEKIANNGLKMKIVNYRNSNDIDVEFEDGYMARHKSLGSWKSGTIAHPKYPNGTIHKQESRIGESVIATNGMKMTIIAYKNCRNLDIQFEDGTIVRNKRYSHFIKGNIAHPGNNLKLKSPNKKMNLKTKRDYSLERVGEFLEMKNGLIATIIAYRTAKDIDVEFNDGTTACHKAYSSFKKGLISSKGNKQRAIKAKRVIQRIGLESMSINGLLMKIVKYRNCKDVDIEFEDGHIVCHKTMDGFNKGYAFGYYPHKNDKRSSNKKDYALERVGMKNLNKNGLMMEIIEYRKNSDIDVCFEDGTIVRHVTFRDFQRGYKNIGKTKKEVLEKQRNERLGESTILKTGQEVTIIEYNGARDITVQFDDGVIVKARYSEFQRGYIRHPNKNFNKISFEEFLLADYLKSYGFERMGPGSLKDIDEDFGKMEFDIYNQKLKIAIEFDGPFHDKKRHIEGDLKKDELCYKHGIRMIRIRSNSKIIDSKFSKQIPFRLNINSFNNFPELIELIKNTYSDLSYIKSENPDVSEVLKKFYSFTHKKSEHIGEKKMSKCGLEMEIIEWVNSHNITVKFSDGLIIKNRRYDDFLKNSIKHHSSDYVSPDKRLGESVIANNGLTATIIRYETEKDIDVKFSDGSFAYHRNYINFKRGQIAPDKKSKSTRV